MPKAIFDTGLLKTVLSKLSQAVPKKPVLPVLGSVLLKVDGNAAALTVTDLELTIQYRMDCESKDAFEVLVPFDFFQKVISLTSHQPLTFTSDKKNITLTTAADRYTISGLDKVEDFPKLPEVAAGEGFTPDADFFTWLKQAQHTCGSDILRPVMTFVCLEISSRGMILCSTDAHTAYVHDLPQPEAKLPDTAQVMITPRIIKTLTEEKEIAFSWDASFIRFAGPSVDIYSRRPEGRFPDIQVVFPRPEPNLQLNRADAVAALKRVCLTSEATKYTTISLTDTGEITLEAVDEDLQRTIQVHLAATYTGSVGAIAVSADKMLKMLEQVDYEEITIHITAPNRAIQFTADADAGYRAILMPLTPVQKQPTP